MQGYCARSAAELGNVYLSNWVPPPDLNISNTGTAPGSAGILLFQQEDKY